MAIRRYLLTTNHVALVSSKRQCIVQLADGELRVLESTRVLTISVGNQHATTGMVQLVDELLLEFL
jgi:hypothetical protein